MEGFALQQAFRSLRPEMSARVISRLEATGNGEGCPLLSDGDCLLYEARPLICRTHGFPLLITEETGEERLDFCPENFLALDAFQADGIIDLNVLNATLAAVNHLFMAEYFGGNLPERERVSLGDFLRASGEEPPGRE